MQNVTAGLSFVYTVTIGQAMIMGFSAFGILSGAVSLLVMVKNHDTQIKALKKDFETLRADLSEDMKDVRRTTHTIMGFIQTLVDKEK